MDLKKKKNILVVIVKRGCVHEVPLRTLHNLQQVIGGTLCVGNVQ